MWSNVSLGLKLMLSLLFAKRVTVIASVLNQTNFSPRFIIRGIRYTFTRMRFEPGPYSFRD
jgi:hypothetical protein